MDIKLIIGMLIPIVFVIFTFWSLYREIMGRVFSDGKK